MYNNEKFEERDSIVLTNNGQKIFGIYHKPLSTKSYPVVLVCHGLGGHKTGKYRLYVKLAEHLAKAGIATLRIDFRGSGDSEGEFNQMTLSGEVSDALKGLEFLAKDPHTDKDRIGLFGRSFGGAVAVIAASQFQNIKSLALWAPVFDADQWKEQWKQVQSQNLPKEKKEDLVRINGLVPGVDFFRELFSMRLDKDMHELSHIPLLHIHGEKDHIVSLVHADKYQQLRESSQGKSQFRRLPQCDHDFSHPIEQELALEETWRWFENTL